MSKNIEEIVGEIFPEDQFHTQENIYSDAVDDCRGALKQALTDKKLVVPMSEEDIEQAIYDIPEEYVDDFCDEHIKGISKAIYERQFKGE